QRLGRVELEGRALGAGEPARRLPRGQGVGAAAEIERHRGDVALRHVHVPARRVAVDVAGERARIAPRLGAQRAGRGGGAELEARGAAGEWMNDWERGGEAGARGG